MKYDVYINGSSAKVFARGIIDDDGFLPDAKPLFECPRDSDEWFNWCEQNNLSNSDDAIRKCELVCQYNAEFVNDILEKAQGLFNRYRSEGAEAGWGELAIDFSGMSYTYRRSAAWKDEPTYYTFEQSLKWTNKKFAQDESLTGFALRARDNLVQLWGMADALYELGLSLVFDKDFKLHIFGAQKGWKTSYVF